MSNQVRCKACGFIFAAGKYQVCPACGVPEKMFEPYEDKLPIERKKILDLHIHPVIVHAPQALAFILLFLTFGVIGLSQLGFTGQALDYIFITLKVLSIALPLTVLGGFFSGLFDGKYRYKTVTTIILKKKIYVGSLFILVSIGMLLASLIPDLDRQIGPQILYLVLNLIAFGCTVILGIWGASLTHGAMGGPFVKKKKSTPPPAASTETKPAE